MMETATAFAQTANSQVHAAVYAVAEPIEAIAVQEPLQRRSLAVQRLWRARLLEDLNRILPARETPRGIEITVSEPLLSSTDTVPAPTYDKLAKIAELIPPDATIRVEGYTDDLGSSEKNLDGSYGRAEAVRDVLVTNDNASRTILATGFVSNARTAGRTARRVEIVIGGKGIAPDFLSRRAYALVSR